MLAQWTFEVVVEIRTKEGQLVRPCLAHPHYTQ
jgi:hypothetical protein